MHPHPLATLLRGLAKLILIVFAVDQVLTVLFGFVVRQLDASVSNQTLMFFSCATCGLLSMWLQADARRAFGAAKQKGFVTLDQDGNAAPAVARECPRRWLVLLHLELNPIAART